MRFPKTYRREKRQLALTGDHAQSKPNLSLTLAPAQTGNFLELNSIGKTGGDKFKVDILGQVTGLGGAFFFGLKSNNNVISLNAGGSNLQADVLLNTSSGGSAYSFGYSQSTAQFYLSDNVSRQYFAIAGSSGAFTTIGGNTLDDGSGNMTVYGTVNSTYGGFYTANANFTTTNGVIQTVNGTIEWQSNFLGNSSQFDGGAITTDGSGNFTASQLTINNSTGYAQWSLDAGANQLYLWNNNNGFRQFVFDLNANSITSNNNTIDDGSGNMIASGDMTANGYFLSPSPVGGLQAGFLPDGGNAPIANFGINMTQFGSPNSSYSGGLFRLDSRGTYPFFQVIYQAAGDTNTSDQLVPLCIINPNTTATMPAVAIGWPTNGGTNTGTGNNENLQVHGNTWTGGTMNAVGGYLINGGQTLQSFSGVQIYNQQNFGGF